MQQQTLEAAASCVPFNQTRAFNFKKATSIYKGETKGHTSCTVPSPGPSPCLFIGEYFDELDDANSVLLT